MHRQDVSKPTLKRPNNAMFRAVILVLGGAVVLAIASYIAIPMVPVPITLQTLAVTTIGALYGPRLGAFTVIVWLAMGMLGLPVFAGGGGGISHFLGPTAGYLLAFPVAAAVTGGLVARGWTGQKPAFAFAAMLIGNLVCLSLGAAWLATQIGLQAAINAGFAPFLPGAAIKSAMGMALLWLAGK